MIGLCLDSSRRKRNSKIWKKKMMVSVISGRLKMFNVICSVLGQMEDECGVTFSESQKELIV